MGIGIRYDDGGGTFKPLASFRGMSGGGRAKTPLASYRGMRSPWQGGCKSLVEKMKERKEREELKFVKEDLDANDKRVRGKVVGGAPMAHPKDADATSRGANSHEPWERSFLSGLHAEEEVATGRVVVWGYLRTDRFTGEGRAFETTGETKIPVYSFFRSKEPSPAPFDIVTGDDFVKKIVRCVFFYGKEKVTIGDFSLEDIAEEGEGHVYLVMTEQEGQSATFNLSTEAGTGDGVTNFPLYDFEDGKVTCDYRTTFLTLGGGVGGGEVEVDDKSIAKKTDGKLEIKGYNDLTNTQTDKSFAQMITPPYDAESPTSETIERDRVSNSATNVKYRSVGRFYSGSDSNITFTHDRNGGVAINVYYK